MPNHLPKVEADVDRVKKLMRDFALRCYELADERDQDNFRFETLGIIAIVTFEDDDGQTAEDTAAAFESKRHHVQTGILVDLINGRVETRYSG